MPFLYFKVNRSNPSSLHCVSEHMQCWEQECWLCVIEVSVRWMRKLMRSASVAACRVMGDAKLLRCLKSIVLNKAHYFVVINNNRFCFLYLVCICGNAQGCILTVNDLLLSMSDIIDGQNLLNLNWTFCVLKQMVRHLDETPTTRDSGRVNVS